VPDWDTVGMRATQSHSTRLAGAIAEPSRVLRRLVPGPSGDPYIFAIFANFEILISAVYLGIAERALELAATAAATRSSTRTGTTLDQDPVIRWKIADAAMAVDAVSPRIAALARAVDVREDLGDQWYRQLVGLKLAATSAARFVVDQAIAVAGGASYRASSELGRLARDVMAGGFHPSSTDSAHQSVATAVLGPVRDG